MKYVDYACAWILFAAGVGGMVATEVRHPPQAVLDTPLLWIFVATFNLLRLRNGNGVKGLNVSCTGANLAALALEAVRLKMFGPFGLVVGLPILAELIFSARTMIVGREHSPTEGKGRFHQYLLTLGLRRVPLAAEALHVFLFALTWTLYGIQQQPLLNGPSRWPFAIVFLTDFPISVVAFGAMFGGQPHTLYFLTAWGVLGTLWWYFLGHLIERRR
jgi:hypothetical protein